MVAIVAPLGDLAVSVVKRALGVKDMGTALPGHGGVFDRFDALLFVLPAVYYLVPGWQTKIYRGWLLAFYPIGFVISHVVLAAIWYLLFTPLALGRRLFAGKVAPLKAALLDQRLIAGVGV